MYVFSQVFFRKKAFVRLLSEWAIASVAGNGKG